MMGVPPAGKGKMQEQDAGVDEVLAALGYNVRASDMAEVAQKLEQLDMIIGNAQEDAAIISHLSAETVHYNPSDIATWIETMISEINPVPVAARIPPPRSIFDENRGGNGGLWVAGDGIISSSAAVEESTTTTVSTFGAETGPLPDYHDDDGGIEKVVYGRRGGEKEASPREKKRIKKEPGTSSSGVSGARPVVVVDTQGTGIRLVHTLMACAEAIQQENRVAAEGLVKQIGFLAVSQAGAMRKVATFFEDALMRRIYGLPPQDPVDALSDFLQLHFYESSPYLKFAHFTANQAILEAFAGKNHVHVIDFSMKQGMQWPALMQALALRSSGPPSFRLTGIGSPQPDGSDPLQDAGWKLAQLAQTIGIQFEYKSFIASNLGDIEAYMLELRPSEIETVAVNSIFELHKVLAVPGSIDRVLGLIRDIKPQIITVVEQEANHNSPVFLDRFTESLHYYSSLFDSFEGSGSNRNDAAASSTSSSLTHQDQLMSELYLGRQICNIVACEGAERTERHETLSQWRSRMETAGFAAKHLGSNAFKQASMLLALFAGGDGYRVEENQGCLMLGWHTRPLISTSAWQLPSSSSSSCTPSSSSSPPISGQPV